MFKKLFSLLLLAGLVAPVLSFADPTTTASNLLSFTKNKSGIDTVLINASNDPSAIAQKEGVVVVPSSMDLSATLTAPPLYCNVGDKITFTVLVLVSAEDAQNIDFNDPKFNEPSLTAVGLCGSLSSSFQNENEQMGLYPKQLTADQINSFITSMGLDPSQNVCFLPISTTDGDALISADLDPTAILYASPAPYLPVAQNAGEEDVNFTGILHINAHTEQTGTHEEGWLWWKHSVPTMTQVPASAKTINVTLPIVVSAAVDNQTLATPVSGPIK